MVFILLYKAFGWVAVYLPLTTAMELLLIFLLLPATFLVSNWVLERLQEESSALVRPDQCR